MYVMVFVCNRIPLFVIYLLLPGVSKTQWHSPIVNLRDYPPPSWEIATTKFWHGAWSITRHYMRDFEIYIAHYKWNNFRGDYPVTLFYGPFPKQGVGKQNSVNLSVWNPPSKAWFCTFHCILYVAFIFFFISVNLCFLFVSHLLAYILPNPKTTASIHLDDPDQDQRSEITRIIGNQRNEESTLGKNSVVPLMYYELSNLGSLTLIWIIARECTLKI